MTGLTAAYQGRRVMVTGHTGFKGSWLTLWLQSMGAHVSGFALPQPSGPSHWALLGLDVRECLADIRDRRRIAAFVRECGPEIVFHLAAQPIVYDSYEDPLNTWSTNVNGTANLLEACLAARGVRAIVVVTSDKVYDHADTRPRNEEDRLGGSDPYSFSKAAVELLVASYRSAFASHAGSASMATARAGNVIGGGDWAPHRLVPDAARAVANGSPLRVRRPATVRPWQHVLDVLRGYLLLGARLLDGGPGHEGAWNFGPDPQRVHTVAAVLDRLSDAWPSLTCEPCELQWPPEAAYLMLSSAKAERLLAWRPVWPFEDTVRRSAEWYSEFLRSGAVISRRQLDEYLAQCEAQAAVAQE